LGSADKEVEDDTVVPEVVSALGSPDEGSGTITVGPHQACSVPKGVVHRTRAPRRTTILMVEDAGVMPVGD
jgi:hypothetical protein